MEALQRALLSNLGWAFTLAGVAAIAGRLASVRRRPWISHVLWVLVLVKLVSPPIVNVDPAFLWNREISVEPPLKIVTTPLIEPETEPIANEPVPAVVDLQPAMPVQEPTPTKAEPIPTPVVRWVPDWRTILASFWLTGTLTWWLLLIVKVWRFRILLADAHPADPTLAARVEAIARRFSLRRAPVIFLIPARVPPMLLALFGNPRLLLPSELWSKLDDSARETILVHELAHLKRRDHWVRRLEVIVLGLHWWNPVAWWACREVEKAEEQCCDALVIATLPDSREWYAEALLATALFLSGTRSLRPLGASGIGRVLSLRERMIMILKPSDAQKSTPSLVRRAWIAGALSVLILPGWGAGAAFLRAADAQREADAVLAGPVQEPGKNQEASPTPPATPEGVLPAPAGRLDEVAVVQPIVSDVSPYADFGGQVVAARSVDVRPQVSGILIKDNTVSGSMVEEGAVLFEIDPVVYELEVQKAETVVHRATTERDRADDRVKYSADMKKTGGISNESHANNIDTASAKKDALKLATLELDLAKHRLALTKVKAPISGRLNFSKAGKGDLVVADQTSLATIDKIDPICVDFHVDAQTVAHMSRLKRKKVMKFAIEAGLPIAVMTGDDPESFRHGKIESVNTKFDPANGTLRCRVALPNPDGELISGLSARVRVFLGPVAKSVLIPSDNIADHSSGRRWAVQVVGEDDIPKRREILIGQHSVGGMRIVEEGLNGTEWIVRSGDADTKNQTKIKPRKESLPPLFGPQHAE